MDITTKAIVLKGTDYRENDKLILLYSLDMGKITAVAKGVKKATAKLKFVQQPFCFANFEFVETADRLTLKTAEQIESFYTLGNDVEKYYCASAVLETLVNCEQESEPNASIFLTTLKALKTLSETSTFPLLVLCKFFCDYLKHSGYGLDFERCNVCKCKTDERKLYLDLQLGGVVCVNCRTSAALSVSPSIKTNLSLIENLEYEQLSRLLLTTSQQKDATKLLYGYISHSFAPMKSVSELLSII